MWRSDGVRDTPALRSLTLGATTFLAVLAVNLLVVPTKLRLSYAVLSSPPGGVDCSSKAQAAVQSGATTTSQPDDSDVDEPGPVAPVAASTATATTSTTIATTSTTAATTSTSAATTPPPTTTGAAAAAEGWGPVPPYLPQDILAYYDEKLAARMRSALAAGAVEGAQPAQRFEYERCHRSDETQAAMKCLNSHKDSVFEAANVSFSLPTKYLSAVGADVESNKNIVRMAKGATRGCVAYGAGIAGNSEFEERLAKAGCEVHAFDCTVARDAASVRKKHFTFHKWCIGSLGDVSFKGNIYAKSSEGLEFRSLDNITKELGHTRIDVFKMDVEGFEYGILESELLRSSILPLQIAFELHTEEASTHFVPVENSKGKGYNQVSRLFLQLYDAGYRVISKQVNQYDPACAEYVLINVKQLQR